MSIRVMAQIWETGPEDRTELLVMLALADFSNDEGKCWPSVKSIAAKSRMKERGTQQVIRRLEAAGWLKIETGGGRRGCNEYTLNPAPSCTPAQDAPLHSDAPPPCTAMRETLHGHAPEPSRTINEPSEDTPCIPQPEEPAAAKKPRRACALPDEWVPSEKNLSDAYDRNFSDEEISHEAHQFRDHHLARGTTFKNWDAAWRTWLGNARKFGNRGIPRQTRANGYGQGSGVAGAVARRRAASRH